MARKVQPAEGFEKALVVVEYHAPVRPGLWYEVAGEPDLEEEEEEEEEEEVGEAAGGREAPGARRPAPGISRASNGIATRLSRNSHPGNAQRSIRLYPVLNVPLLLEGVFRDEWGGALSRNGG